MHYYYGGVASWGWFYNYHYAPRISGELSMYFLSSSFLISISDLDLQGLEHMTFNFDLGRPFRPFEQLMGVLPAASRDLIPQAYRVGFALFLHVHVSSRYV